MMQENQLFYIAKNYNLFFNSIEKNYNEIDLKSVRFNKLAATGNKWLKTAGAYAAKGNEEIISEMDGDASRRFRLEQKRAAEHDATGFGRLRVPPGDECISKTNE
jgi:hypothetical protein